MNKKKKFKKIFKLYEYFKYLRNPLSALFFKFGLKKECDIKIKNTNRVIHLKRVQVLNSLMHNLPFVTSEKFIELIDYIESINNDEDIIQIGGINYVNGYNTIFLKEYPFNLNIHNEEYFSDDQWDMINLSNRNVIDIGANIADTPLYFAKNGANVIAFEPVKHLYELGLKNISLNPELKDKIVFINKAVGAKNGFIDITSDSMKEYINNDDSYSVEVITIKNIFEDYDFPADVLKMDCEGCEFEIILNYDLSMFNDIIFEHHAEMTGKDYNQLITKLEEQNFEIKKIICKNCRETFDNIGIIHAFKK